MFRLALKNLSANAIRLTLTGFAIVLGVAFVVSSFVLRDGLSESFESLSAEIVQGTDLQVSGLDDERLTDADLATLNAEPGIRVAEGSIGAFDNSVVPYKADGSAVPTGNGPPVIAFSWVVDEVLNPTTIVDGAPPTGPDEWVLDIDAADNHGFVIGETYDFLTPSGTRSATLTGTFRFGEDNTTNGAVLIGIEEMTARDFFVAPAGWDSIAISMDGSVPLDDLQENVAVALGNAPGSTALVGEGESAAPVFAEGDRVEVQNSAQLQAETAAEFNEFIDVFGWILRVFAIITLFVSIFIIYNTFNIVTGQRIRELGLLRAVGATPSQIRRSVIAEGLAIGVVASVIGLGGGAALALLLRAALNALNFSLPAFDIILSSTTIFWGMALGIVATLLSALFPAITASRISPVTAISGHAQARERSNLRYALGVAVSMIGVVLLVLALFALSGTQPVLITLGVGAGVLFLGLVMLSPLAAGPLSRFFGAPLGRILGTPGELSKENAARNPRRTASTAAALMIGLSLASMAFVLGDSFKAEIRSIFDDGIQADYVVNTMAFNIPDEVEARLDDDPAFGAVSNVRFWEVDLENDRADATVAGEGSGASVAAIDFSDGGEIFRVGVIEGDLTTVDDASTAIDDDLAEELGVGLGDELRMELDSGETAALEIRAIFTDPGFLSEMLITENRFFDISDQPTSDFVYAQRAADVSVEAADARFADIGVDYPNLEFQSAAEARESFASIIDNLLAILQLLLAMTIIIALFGIANTMALAVVERTREIGLLRAVGMVRTQARRMVRWEAAIVSLVGAFLGAAIGVGLGLLLVEAIPDTILDQTSIPWFSIGAMMAVSAVAGLISAFIPAFRASRMNVLEAISHS